MSEADVCPFIGQYQPKIVIIGQRLICGHLLDSISLR